MLVFFGGGDFDRPAVTEILGRDIRANDPRMSAGCPSPKLPLWADNRSWNYPRPNCLLIYLPNCLLPHQRGLLFLFQNCPRSEGHCAANERQKLSCGWDASPGPLGKQKISMKHVWLQKCEIGEECRQFWMWVLGVNLFGRPETKPKNSREKFARRILLRISFAIFLKSPGQIKKCTPNPLSRASGSRFPLDFDDSHQWLPHFSQSTQDLRQFQSIFSRL